MNRSLMLTTFLFLPCMSDASAQSAASVVTEMYAAYERYTEGVNDYRVVQRSMGVSTVSYFEREVVDGKALFRLRESSAGSYGFTLGGQPVGYGDVYIFGPVLAQRGSYSGLEELDGRPTHVLTVDDLAGLRLSGPTGADEIAFVPSSARVYVDAELWIPIGFDFDGTAETVGGPQNVRIVSRLSDVQNHGRLPIPHHTVIRVDGLEAAIDPEARARLEELRAQLDAMPPVQRQLMEEMMAEEMESLRRLMGGDGEPTVIEVDVTSVAVNEGPPR